MTPLRCRLGLHALELSRLHFGSVHDHQECRLCGARRLMPARRRGPIDFAWLGGGAVSESTSKENQE